MSGTSVKAASVKTLGASRTAMAVAAGIGVALVVATAALWLHYGTAVFYEMIVAGIAACL